MKALRFIMFATIAILLAGYVAGFFLSDEWRARAERTIAAPPAAIHSWLADPKKLAEWLPWRAKDPEWRVTTSGAERGAGAVLRWESDKVGFATLSITRSDPTFGIAYDLVFDGSPHASHGSIELAPRGDSTLVAWQDGGKVVDSPIPKLFRALNERKLALDFKAGLDTLAKKVEAR